MSERPPVANLTRGIVSAALGSGLTQIVLAAYYGIAMLTRGDADEVLKLNVVVPAILFGGCVGFAWGL